MNWSKTTLMQTIKESKAGIEMCAQILACVKEFEHCSQVNDKFIDRIREFDCWAHIQDNKNSSELFVCKNLYSGAPVAEFNIYLAKVRGKSGITWEAIKENVEKEDWDFTCRLKEANERLNVIDEEVKEAKDLLNSIKEKKFTCFDFDKLIYEIEGAIREA